MADSCTLALYVASWRRYRRVCRGNTVVAHAKNMQCSCTWNVRVYTMYVHVNTMYVQYNVCTWYNQLSEQVFVADTEMQMQDWGISLWPSDSDARDNMDQGSSCPEDGDFFMQGQMLQKQRRPSTVVVYAYNMWHPCTVYVHIYTVYVHIYTVCTRICNVCAWFNQLS